MNADSIPRYVPPSFDELVDYLTPDPEQVMQNCAHCAACIRIIERFTDERFKSTDSVWHRMAVIADCLNCLEYE